MVKQYALKQNALLGSVLHKWYLLLEKLLLKTTVASVLG
jgi:hypothetical protein